MFKNCKVMNGAWKSDMQPAGTVQRAQAWNHWRTSFSAHASQDISEVFAAVLSGRVNQQHRPKQQQGIWKVLQQRRQLKNER